MSMGITARVRRGLIAVPVAIGLVVGVSACGGSGDDDKPDASASSSRSSESKPEAHEEASEEPLAELKGPSGLILKVTGAQRDSGGFVTVSGELKNDGDKTVTVPAQLSGNETEIIRNGRSLGGATLVDSKGKKRYYVLRDTEGRPLTTTNFSAVKAGETLPVFMQFPAPPATATELTLQLPMFSTALIEISG
ncbi:hypothetical protein EF913_01880 [Streptomyces sp. WAC04189]|uniref:hypothetical protein n=1 Tax=Streptomyces TaxID=1883 RepID=UPI000EE83526|nr:MULTISPECIES: hypothetical protein [Streptomyces]MBD2817594.1 hypothetical protein [Streptomyces parvulus]RIH60817.1 hypothetical protein D3C59_16350 [Streptomyces sp. SHP22-7]MCC8452291.1 hypothetical protein [Streptomyces rochei]NUV91862.1 hypothetical protein [Streptomyces sp. KAI 90]RSS06479.1 hypothetical protein EF913_01880 [Streptomyces sp. WAC04189]